MSSFIPGSEPYYLPGGPTGCILLHGFSSTPEEMRPLGDYLHSRGCTVLGLHLAGFATHPNDLRRVRWTDWLDNVADGLAYLSQTCLVRVLIGQSMGGAIALSAASRLPVSGVVALSTPFGLPSGPMWLDRFKLMLQPTIRKPVLRFPAHHPLYHRRELNYPAYPEFPSRILLQLGGLAADLERCLAQVQVPVLLMHSRADHSVPFTSMEQIYQQLGSLHKEKLLLEGMDHSLVRDPHNQQVFDAIGSFLSSLSAASTPTGGV